ncbi:DnaD domain-containing protein [Streptococcus moroccensis]|uniref:DNA replication protein n=1 Tax=Streptococcus moroccensis TaxID=1451356 RepID=A0ABT9YPU8_9STRE|nr:DnaD domain protein [Streptococcus moroccensis]MDQ0222011.1 DNA replication protein [Streptococcus moroccensis]
MTKKELFGNFEKNWGRLLSPFEIEEITVLMNQDNFEPEVVNEALRLSVLQQKPFMPYLVKILKNWKSRNIMTVEQVRYHEQKRQHEMNPVGNAEMGAEMLRIAKKLWN